MPTMPRGTQIHRPRWDGTRVARDMMRAGLTQTKLAKRAKVTEATVSRLINGHGVSPLLAAKVASVLGHPLDRYLDAVVVDPPALPPMNLSA